MATNLRRVVVVQRHVSSLSSPELATLQPGEWFCVRDQNSIFWKNPITNTIEALTSSGIKSASTVKWDAPNSTYVLDGVDPNFIANRTKVSFTTPKDSTGGDIVKVNGKTLTILGDDNFPISVGKLPADLYLELVYVNNGGKEALQLLNAGGSNYYPAGVTVEGVSLFDTIYANSHYETYTNMGMNNVIDLKQANFFKKTVTGDVTFTVVVPKTPEPLVNTVKSFLLEVTNGGNFMVNWFPNIYWDNNSPPTLASDGTTLILFYTTDDGLTWNGIVSLGVVRQNNSFVPN